MITPADPKQCQAERGNGASALSLAGKPEYVRCTNRPSVFATELKPGKDGRRGRMSLCTSCKAVLIRQEPGRARFTPIKSK